MDITIALAASRLVAQQRAMDVTANNIANANTPGYRTERVQFSDWIDNQSGSASTPGVKSISYTQDRATYREPQPGSITHTGNPFDLALTGDGYFTVNTKNGPRLTRDGRFGPMPDGTLADSSGNAVLDTSGKPIQIPPTDTRVTIAGDGSVSTEERANRQDRRRPAKRCDEAASGRRYQFRFGRGYRSGAIACNRSGRDRGVQRSAGAGGDPDDGQRACNSSSSPSLSRLKEIGCKTPLRNCCRRDRAHSTHPPA